LIGPKGKFSKAQTASFEAAFVENYLNHHVLHPPAHSWALYGHVLEKKHVALDSVLLKATTQLLDK
jgi:hypothetical protein